MAAFRLLIVNTMKQYLDVLQILKHAAIKPLVLKPSTPLDFYEYGDFPLAHEFEGLYNFGQEFLERTDVDFPLQNAYVFFNNAVNINAAARTEGEYQLVEIFKGAVFGLYKLFDELQSPLSRPEFHSFTAATQHARIPPHYFLFQICTLYSLYHEVGHLIQHKRAKAEEMYIEFSDENCADVREVDTRHAKEMDADWFAASQLGGHLLEYGRGHGKDVSADTVGVLASLAVAGIFLYQMKQVSGLNIYFREQTHPHPIVRVCYMIVYILENLQGNAAFEIDQQEVLSRALSMCIRLYEITEDASVEEFGADVFGHLDDVQEYVRHMQHTASGIPNLCVNTLPK